MNKTDLIEVIAKDADISKSAAGRAIDAFTNAVTKALSDGDTVQVLKFGTFKVNERSARTGRNPSTGESIEIPAKKVPSWKPSKDLIK